MPRAGAWHARWTRATFYMKKVDGSLRQWLEGRVLRAVPKDIPVLRPRLSGQAAPHGATQMQILAMQVPTFIWKMHEAVQATGSHVPPEHVPFEQVCPA